MKLDMAWNQCAILILFAFVGAAQAQDRYMSRGASVEDYRNALQQSRGIRPAPAKRPRRGLDSGKARASASGSSSGSSSSVADVYRPPAGQSVADATSPGGVSVQVYFAYDSAILTDAAKVELDKLGQALASSEFADDRWFIEGHTDASGPADYNEALSQRRAISVMSYLVESHHIAPALLIPVGKGESEPYDAARPNASINRRVRVKPAGG